MDQPNKHTLNDELDYIYNNGSSRYTFDRAKRRFDSLSKMLKKLLSTYEYNKLSDALLWIDPNYPDTDLASYHYDNFTTVINEIKNKIGKCEL